MEDSLTPRMKAEIQKAKKRAKINNATGEDVEMIPAIREQKNIFDDATVKLVGIYVRVSTDDPNQTTSYEMQKSYYEDYVKRHPNWKLVEIFADEGISGTSLKKRDNFVRMIKAAEEGRINLIVTKQVSRFARNIVDCLWHVRKLAAIRPLPVGVFFEIDNIYTLNPEMEMQLNFASMLAQEESHMKSKLLTDAYRKRSRYGIVYAPELLGYDLDENDNLIINEDEAQTIRLIFFMYLYGYTCAKIAETLMELDRRTNQQDPKTGIYNTKWSASTVLMQLQNERHCGHMLTQKSFKPSYLDSKVYKNRGELPQFLKRNHHPPIITPDDYAAVQRIIGSAKYGNKGVPQLRVVTEGALEGFVSINPRWAAFRAEDYISASLSVYGEEQPQDVPLEVVVQDGELDLRNFQVVHTQFFDTSQKKCITFSTENMWFSSDCIRKFNNAMTVEILINPIKKVLAVRPCAKDYRNGVRWAKIEGDKYMQRQISGAAFLKTLYEIFGWDKDCRYRVRGVRRQKGDESVMLFDMNETEIFISTEAIGDEIKGLRPILPLCNNRLTVFSQEFIDEFGQDNYRHLQAREIAAIDRDGKWNVSEECQLVCDKNALNVTSETVLSENIQNIMSDMAQGETNDGN